MNLLTKGTMWSLRNDHSLCFMHAKEVYDSALSFKHLPPPIATDLFLEALEQGFEVCWIFFKTGSPALRWEAVLGVQEHGLCRLLLTLQAITWASCEPQNRMLEVIII